ncbi:hypothetical protein D0865_01811 [Hortaea werneckii]|uniref:Major facilitator superfamily (MFS) profile domain-containing protein n=1 Tax=Hortaea werneckii TaxID=91943 RepID=A0A3M7D6H1_HORWE|nr:hypothetical protein D0865_01811 [Hortaea werneckii]
MELPLRGSKRGYAKQTQACVGKGDDNINFAAERGRMVSDKSAIPLSRICNARLVGLEDDLNLRGHDYNTLLSCFCVSYVVFEIPANMAYRFGSLVRWRMVFAIEGVITIGLSLIGFATLTDRPATATWLTQEGKDLAGARVKSERLGATEVLDRVDSKKTLRGIFSPVTLATAFIFLLNNITVQGLTFFAPTIVRTIYPDATVVSQQLHTVPPYVVGSFFCLALSMLSSRIDNRLYIFIGSAPMVMVGYAIANVVSDTARSSAIGTNVMMGNIGGLIVRWSFLPSDRPEYPIGNGLNLAAATLILICSLTLLFWMRVDNKRRAGRDVDAESDRFDEGKLQRLDWKHPAFEWRP